ncbi:hypothetical protein R1sor_025895 [Riccia sorocarpa]|uniref:PGG domain-containing protein n=1 Tax=Riccia sorocarpa TaxID=122646 RepID=A0ABD3G9W3_9MARC
MTVGDDREDSASNMKTALHLAAEQAQPEILKIMLKSRRFDVHAKDGGGNTLLHAAVFSEVSISLPVMLIDFVEIFEECSGRLCDLEQSSITEDQHRENIKLESLEYRRKCCINLLFEEGVDIWKSNNLGNTADPGPKASSDYTLWWNEKLALKTEDEKASYNAGAAAISVTAALVATASYIGPLQPPLGYNSVDRVDTEILAVRVFFVCNTVAFYLAIAAVLHSLASSLSMRTSTREKLAFMQTNVKMGLLYLNLALIASLSAFAAASLVVVPVEKRNQAVVIPLLLGCDACVIAKKDLPQRFASHVVLIESFMPGNQRDHHLGSLESSFGLM